MHKTPEKTIVEFIRYNNWANKQIIAACTMLDEEQLEATLPGSYGSVYATLAHIINAEAFYLWFLTDIFQDPPFDWAATPDLAAVQAYAGQISAALAAAIDRVGPTDRVYDEEGPSGRASWQALAIFIQIINHGVEHRTNITSILNAAQLAPPAVDGWAYLRAFPERFAYQPG